MSPEVPSAEGEHRYAPWRRTVNAVIVAVLFAIYATAFPFLYAAAGPGVGALVIGPIVAASWFWGLRRGLLFALLTGGVGNFLLYLFFHTPSGRADLLLQSLPPCVVFLLVAACVGRLSDLGARLNRELAERARTAQALQRSEQKYRSLVEDVREVVFRIDAAGRWAYLNPAWTAITGFSVEETLGRPFWNLLPPEHQDAAKAIADQLVHDGDTSYQRYRARCRTRSGGQRWLDVRIQPVQGDAGTVTGFAGVLSDVTDSVQVEKERAARRATEELSRLKSNFLSTVNHEMRTPLTSILGFTEILAEEIDAPQQEFVHFIEESADRLSTTLDAILRFTEAESNHLTVDLQRLDLAATARAVVAAFEPEAAAKALTLHADLPEDAAPVHADEEKLRLILENLLDNAVKYTERGAVRVTICSDGEHTLLRVADTGMGIDAAHQAHLFDAFRQASSDAHHPHNGIGLGLTLAQQFAGLMDGTISVESALGEGSTFTLRLPRAPAAEQTAEQAAELHAPPLLEPV